MTMPSIADLRNTTQIIAEDALEDMLTRFIEFVGITDETYANWQTAFDVFFEPVDYFAFLAFQGKKVTIDDQTHVILSPTNWEYDGKNKKVSMPSKAHAPIKARFGGFRSPYSPDFPVDADMKIYFDCQPNDEKPYRPNRSIALSYNQLTGRCSSGRTSHWIEDYKEAVPMRNAFLAGLSQSSWGPADPLYRKTPEGQKKVNEILYPGMLIEITRDGCADRKYIVASVSKPYEYRPIERPEDHVFENFSLSLIDPVTRKGGYYLNELVAVDGVIRGLFFANETVVEIRDFGLDCAVVAEDDDLDDDNEIDCDCEIYTTPLKAVYVKPIQLTLF
jgi:hypothetical protein